MNGKVSYESVSQGKGGLSGPRAKPTYRLSGHVGVVND